MLSDGQHKPSSVKMGYFALKFLLTQIYHKEWAANYLPTPKTAKTLPMVLSKDEVMDGLSAIRNFKHRTVIMFIYSTGARVSECVNIKLTDIDSRRMQVNIQEGKGLKQRKIPLSPMPLTTWGQNKMEHPHLHCIMPVGGMSFDRQHWVHPHKQADFFVYANAISRKFRGKYLAFLKKAYVLGELNIKSTLSPTGRNEMFSNFLDKLYAKEWVVNIQAPLGKPDKILEYLPRYVFRVAITDRRIIEVKDGKVRFHWKDYRTGLFREMALDIDEFIRRYLLHVLPHGFFKVRYYGIFSSRCRKENIQKAKLLLTQERELRDEQTLEDGERVWESRIPYGGRS